MLTTLSSAMFTGVAESAPLFVTAVDVTELHLPLSMFKFAAPNTLVPVAVDVIGVAFCLICMTVADAGAVVSLSPL